MHGGDLLVRAARVPGPAGVRVAGGRIVDTTTADVRIVAGRIAEVGPSLAPHPGEEVLEAAGGAVLPGLHDHHLHLRALAALDRSVEVGPAAVVGADELGRVLRGAPAGADGWVRAVGYHESVAGDLDRWRLDALAPGRRIRVQHRTGVLWVLSSAALDAVHADGADEPGIERGSDGRPTGRLFRLDAWLGDRVPAGTGARSLAAVSTRLAALGVTGVTDAT
ncbi:MAG TPA: amidohydrolase family protein, partial [Acidimicrobiales bacterium]|nr:amidohydrolase family protein [Acidimicrobiales bacterium]